MSLPASILMTLSAVAVYAALLVVVVALVGNRLGEGCD